MKQAEVLHALVYLLVVYCAIHKKRWMKVINRGAWLLQCKQTVCNIVCVRTCPGSVVGAG